MERTLNITPLQWCHDTVGRVKIGFVGSQVSNHPLRSTTASKGTREMKRLTERELQEKRAKGLSSAMNDGGSTISVNEGN